MNWRDIMKNLQLVKSENFGTVQCDFWQDEEGNVLMTREQIGRALGYSEPRKAIQKIHERNKDRLDKFSVVTKLTTTDGKSYETYLYTPKGIYEICRFSRQPKADIFMDWVWDVVESIRRHGAYMTPEKIEEVLMNPDTIIQLATALKEEQQRRLQAERQIEEQKPKVLFAEAWEVSEQSILVGEMAKLLVRNGLGDMGQNRFFKWLRANGYLHKTGEQYNLPTQKSIELGIIEVKTRTITNTNGSVMVTKTPKITVKGQMYFLDKFKEIMNTEKVV